MIAKKIGWFKFDYIKLVQTTLKFQCLVLDSDIQLDILSVMPQQHDEHQKPQQQQQQQHDQHDQHEQVYQHDRDEQPQQQQQVPHQQQKRKVDLEEEPSSKRICTENKSK